MGPLICGKSLRDPATPVTLLICSLAASLAYDIQHTDWLYHAYPFRALLGLTIAYLLIDLLYPVIVKLPSEARLVERTALVASVLIAVLIGFIAVHPRILHPDPKRLQDSELDRFLTRYLPITKSTTLKMLRSTSEYSPPIQASTRRLSLPVG